MTTQTTPLSLDDATEAVYQSLINDNLGLNEHIKNLKAALAAAGQSEATFIPTRLPQNNRTGRKMMQTYFRKRGVTVVFKEGEENAKENAE